MGKGKQVQMRLKQFVREMTIEAIRARDDESPRLGQWAGGQREDPRSGKLSLWELQTSQAREEEGDMRVSFVMEIFCTLMIFT